MSLTDASWTASSPCPYSLPLPEEAGVRKGHVKITVSGGEEKVEEGKVDCLHICLLKSLSADTHWVPWC